MPSSKNSKAQAYWREFEKLSLALIEDQFVTEPTSFCLTRASQDGGFDGDIVVEISGKSGFDFSFRALFEAKLRSGNEGVGLRTFAATLVVAHNAAAHALIIVSNQSYTPQAVTEAARFAQATRMKVRLVNGQVVSGWVKQSRQRLLDEGYTQEFLDWLMESEPEAMSQSVYEIPLPASGHHFDDAVAHLSIGKNDKGKLDCLIEISKTQAILPPVVGAQRQELVRKLIKAMEQPHGVAVFEGDSGSGKSFLLSHAMAGMQHEKHASRLDLSSRLTVNQLFLLIFQRLTGIELASLLVDDSTDRQQIVRVLEAALGKQGSPAFLSAVASVILGSGQRSHGQGDLNRSHLADYLGMVAKAQAGLSPFFAGVRKSE